MKHILATFLLFAGVLATSPLVSAQESLSSEPAPTEESSVAETESPVQAILEAFLVQVTKKDDGSTVETLVVATTAAPGDVIEYKATYTNVSENALTGLVANGPIPASTTYVDKSANITEGAVFEVLIPDEEWQELPAYKSVTDENGKVVRVEATSADYTALRWRISGALDPEKQIVAKYRVKVNR